MSLPDPQNEHNQHPESPDESAWMSAYLDAELEPEQARALEARLQDDSRARDELDDLRRVLHAVAALPRARAPRDFSDKVLRKLRRRRKHERVVALLQGVALPFQVLSILVILAIAALMMLSELERRPSPLERSGRPGASEPLTRPVPR